MRLCFCLFVKKRRCAMKIKPVLILVWLLPLNAWAADGLGLQDAVKMAMDSDPGLQAQTAQIQAFRDDAIAADDWPTPAWRWACVPCRWTALSSTRNP